MRCFLEINLDSYIHNLKIIKQKLLKNEEIMLVVKANCYGLGSIRLAKEAYKFGVRYFAVATIDEGIELRKSGYLKDSVIIILGYTEINRMDDALKYNVLPSITCKENLDDLIKHNIINRHIILSCDSGMSRIGFNIFELMDRDYIDKISSLYYIDQIFTHLPQADSLSKDSIDYTSNEIANFLLLKKYYSDNIKFHFKNSAALLRNIKQESDYVRVGIIQYGITPSSEIKCDELIPIFSFKSKVISIRNVKKGTYVGYGRNYVANNDMKIATISAGYADGVNRRLSNKGYVIIKEKKYQIVGNICMDQFMVDISNSTDIHLEDEVLIFGKTKSSEISIDDIAKEVGTISYEILCNISPRVERIYIKNN